MSGPLSVHIENVRLEGSVANYRFGTRLALREMWPNASGDCKITIRDCPSTGAAVTALNPDGKTLFTGANVLASPNGPTQAQAAVARAEILNCENVYVESTTTRGAIRISDSTIQRATCHSTSATERQALFVDNCTLASPILVGVETTGQLYGANVSAQYPAVLDGVTVLAGWDLAAMVALSGVLVASGVTVTWPAGATTATAFTGWKDGTLWA